MHLFGCQLTNLEWLRMRGQFGGNSALHFHELGHGSTDTDRTVLSGNVGAGIRSIPLLSCFRSNASNNKAQERGSTKPGFLIIWRKGSKHQGVGLFAARCTLGSERPPTRPAVQGLPLRTWKASADQAVVKFHADAVFFCCHRARGHRPGITQATGRIGDLRQSGLIYD